MAIQTAGIPIHVMDAADGGGGDNRDGRWSDLSGSRWPARRPARPSTSRPAVGQGGRGITERVHFAQTSKNLRPGRRRVGGCTDPPSILGSQSPRPTRCGVGGATNTLRSVHKRTPGMRIPRTSHILLARPCRTTLAAPKCLTPWPPPFRSPAS